MRSQGPAIIRLAAAGGVDDGKSTLIGRLIFDASRLYDDQWASLTSASERLGREAPDFSLVTDGLKSEREQAITIDVAYRSFATRRRRFILADCPGHEEYTHNMATAASTATALLLLIDATRGATLQTRRHAALAWLFGIREFVVAVNKMDLAAYSHKRFEEVVTEAATIFRALPGSNAAYIPTVAPGGEGLVSRSAAIPWYAGPTLLQALDDLQPAAPARGAARLPIQAVLRDREGRRSYAGTLLGAPLKPGDRMIAALSGRTASVARLFHASREVASVRPGAAISVEIDREIDLSRGDLLAAASDPVQVSSEVTATAVVAPGPELRAGAKFFAKHCSRYIKATVTKVTSRLNLDTMMPEPADRLTPADIGEVVLHLARPIAFDPYEVNRTTGALILTDPATCATTAAGLLRGPARPRDAPHTAQGRGVVIWLTGLSSAGKSTLAAMLRDRLAATGIATEWLDGDAVRAAIGHDLGFARAERDENIRRISYVASLLSKHGITTVVSAISPYAAARTAAREQIGRFIEVYVNAPISVCEARDVKGLYKRAREGGLHHLTGVDDPYEPPAEPDVEVRTDLELPEACVAKILNAVRTLTGLAVR